jgi:hypothetical protein
VLAFLPIDEPLQDGDRSVRALGFDGSFSLIVAICEHRKRTSKMNSSISEIWNVEDLSLIGNSCLDASNRRFSQPRLDDLSFFG